MFVHKAILLTLSPPQRKTYPGAKVTASQIRPSVFIVDRYPRHKKAAATGVRHILYQYQYQYQYKRSTSIQMWVTIESVGKANTTFRAAETTLTHALLHHTMYPVLCCMACLAHMMSPRSRQKGGKCRKRMQNSKFANSLSNTTG